MRKTLLYFNKDGKATTHRPKQRSASRTRTSCNSSQASQDDSNRGTGANSSNGRASHPEKRDRESNGTSSSSFSLPSPTQQQQCRRELNSISDSRNHNKNSSSNSNGNGSDRNVLSASRATTLSNAKARFEALYNGGEDPSIGSPTATVPSGETTRPHRFQVDERLIAASVLCLASHSASNGSASHVPSAKQNGKRTPFLSEGDAINSAPAPATAGTYTSSDATKPILYRCPQVKLYHERRSQSCQGDAADSLPVSQKPLNAAFVLDYALTDATHDDSGGSCTAAPRRGANGSSAADDASAQERRRCSALQVDVATLLDKAQFVTPTLQEVNSLARESR